MASATQPDDAPDSLPANITRVDVDGNGISDLLDVQLEAMGHSEKVDVVAVFDSEAAVAGARDSLPEQSRGRRFRLIPAFSTSLNRGQIAALANRPGLHRIEHRAVYSVSNDSANADFGTALARIEYSLTGSGVGICIIDTGLDTSHEQFDDLGKVAGWFDPITAAAGPYDNHGHGTHVAGTATGSGTGGANAAKYQGAASGATLYIAKALDGSRFSVGDSVEDSIDWCVLQAGVDIISMSLGDDFASDGLDPLSLMVNAAVDAGKIDVVAAGNDGAAPSSVSAPAAAEKAITVGAVAERSGSPISPNHSPGVYLAPFSSRGPTLAPTSFIKPDISAPGVSIRSALAGTAAMYDENSGTSMATPFVSGTIALMLQADSTLTPSEVSSILSSTAVDRGPAGKDNERGSGLLDGYAAVSEASSVVGYTPTYFPASTSIAGSVADSGLWQHTFEIGGADLSTPIAATILLDGAIECVVPAGPFCFGYAWGPDIDARLLDPNGVPIANSTCAVPVAGGAGCGLWGRQETLAAMPTVAGTYKIEVFPWEGDGRGTTFDVYLSRADFGPSPYQIDKSPDVQTLPADGSVTFTVAVTNISEDEVRQTAVTDTATPGCLRTTTQVRALLNNTGNPVGFLLKPGESFTYTCSATSVTKTFANTATVSGTVSSITFESSDTAEVTDTNPGITVDKSPDVQSLPADGNVTFTISVTNTGAVDLRKTAVTDTAVPGCGRTGSQVRARLRPHRLPGACPAAAAPAPRCVPC